MTRRGILGLFAGLFTSMSASEHVHAWVDSRFLIPAEGNVDAMGNVNLSSQYAWAQICKSCGILRIDPDSKGYYEWARPHIGGEK